MDEPLLLPRLVQKWARDILGARGYMRALNGGPDRRVLQEIAALVEEGTRDQSELAAIFSAVAVRRGGLGEVLAELRRPLRKQAAPRSASSGAAASSMASGASVGAAAHTARTAGGTLVPGAAQRAAATATAGAARPASPAPQGPDLAASIRALEHELGRVRFELHQSRRHAEELETLARELAARAVEDATRIQALEAVVLAIADGSGIGADARQVHAASVQRYLARFSA